MTARFLTTGLLAALLALLPPPARAQGAPPAPEALKMEGRQTLYQRVMTRVGSGLQQEPSATAAMVRPDLPPFTLFYVYERRDGWLRVGEAARGQPAGWLAPGAGIDWKQTIVVAFNNPAAFERERTMLFATKASLEQTILREDVVTRVAQYRSEAAAGQPSATSPIVAIEPAEHIDIERNFYLFPILSAERRALHFGVRGSLLEVASVRKQETPPPRSPDDALKDFRVGITFVIDTTSSMGPYIDYTRRAMERIRSTLDRSDIADRVRFGLVGFRQSETLNQGIGYASRTFLRLGADSTAAQFSREIQRVTPASVPTQGFNEDSVGGIVEATENGDWAKFGARFVVLITDAGPRPPDEGHVRSPMLPEQARSFLAESNGIVPLVLHLKTREGRPNHAYAERAYKALAQGASGSNYWSVQDGDVERFRQTLDTISEQIISLTRASMQGVVPAPPANDDSQQAQLRRDWRAMQLAYLGRETGRQAPDIIRGWMIDKSLDNPGVEALGVRIMLTKNQLATLRDVTRAIIAKADAGLNQFEPRTFFTQLKEAVALMARDPARLARADFSTLGEALGEYLLDLPYESQITGLSEQDWLRRSGIQQRTLITGLKSKIELYERIYNSPQKWVALHPGAPDGERVTTLALRDMP